MKAIKRLSLLFMVLMLAFANSSIAQAFDDFYSDSEIQFIDPDACDPTGANSISNPDPSTSSTPTSGPVYMMGDSITVGVEAPLKEKLSEANLEVSKINGIGSRSMTSPGDGTTNGSQAIASDKTDIQKSKTAILALGTNNSGPADTFRQQVKDLVKDTREAHPDDALKIYYLNIFSHVPHKDGYNNVLKSLATSEDFVIIGTGNANIELNDVQGDRGIHPTSEGYKTLAKTIVDNLTSANPGSPGNLDTPAGCCPAPAEGATTLRGANNEEKVWNYFTDKGLKPEAVAGIMGNISQESGFNPENIQNPAGDTRDPTPLTGTHQGWGLIQWTPGAKVLKAAKDAGVTTPIYELGSQLDIIWWQANNSAPPSGKSIIEEFKQRSTSPREAASAWEALMEAAGNPQMENRWAAADAAMDKYGRSGGGATPVDTPATETGGTCVCTDANPAGSVDVVLDPGHSGEDHQGEIKDPETGLWIGDSSNPGERHQVWDVAQKVNEALTEKGYKVIMTKKKEDSTVDLKERATIANEAKATIAVSIHNTGEGSFGTSEAGWVTPQKVGGYRVNDAGKKTEFTDAKIAEKSLKFSQEIVKARQAAEGDAQLHDLNFNGRAGLSDGNLSIVQLFSKVPWVYNEVSQSGFNGDKYAEGITNGILKGLGTGARGDPGVNDDCTGPVSGDLGATARSYAYPQYHAAPFNKPRAAYAKAIEKAASDGQYTGGSVGGFAGIDCGAYVTRLLIDSGFEPKYNHSGKMSEGAGNTFSQEPWIKANWKSIPVGSTGDLQPGDVAFTGSPDHTYLFVGEVDGWSGPDPKFSSASYSTSGSGRAPMAGQGSPLGADVRWYRKK